MACNLPSETQDPKDALKHLLQLETIGVVTASLLWSGLLSLLFDCFSLFCFVSVFVVFDYRSHLGTDTPCQGGFQSWRFLL